MDEDLQIFTDRSSAGIELGRVLSTLELRPPLVVLGLPRGGVVVAYEVARVLDAPLDVMVVRKVGMPGQPELAIGAVASGNITVREPSALARHSELERAFEQLAAAQRLEVERRERAYRAGEPPLELRGKAVILVDDGLATGATMLAAARAARAADASYLVVAAPVGSSEAEALLRPEADEVVILRVPPLMFAISQWYERFDQVEDTEVQEILRRARRQRA